VTDYSYIVMNRRSIAISVVLAATMSIAAFTSTPPFSMMDAEAQILPSCPVAYERNVLSTCVPLADPDPDGGDRDRTRNRTKECL
jgi:hypothetical protein